MDLHHADLDPKGTQLQHLPLSRLPAQAKWLIAPTTEQLLQLWMHFLGRRTLPCTKSNCPGCLDARPRRYEAYLAACRAIDKKHLILGLTQNAALEMLNQAPDPHALRGTTWIVERLGERPNGMLKATLVPNGCDPKRLPPAPDLEAHLQHIWGLDQNHAGHDAPEYAAGVIRMGRDSASA